MGFLKAFVAPDLHRPTAAGSGHQHSPLQERPPDPLSARFPPHIQAFQRTVASCDPALPSDVNDLPGRPHHRREDLEAHSAHRPTLEFGDPEAVSRVKVMRLQIVQVGVVPALIPLKAVLVVNGAHDLSRVLRVIGSRGANVKQGVHDRVRLYLRTTRNSRPADQQAFASIRGETAGGPGPVGDPMGYAPREEVVVRPDNSTHIMAEWLERYFDLRARRATIRGELRGAVATYLTMAYILVLNPAILQSAGVPLESAVTCTALAAGISTLLMGMYANFPLALASGMGLNAGVALHVASAAGSWQRAMGLVFWDGVVILILVLLGAREAVLAAIPVDLRRGIAGGIGFFIAFLGLVNAQLVVVPGGTVAMLHRDPGAAVLPPVTFGSLTHPPALVALGGLLLTAWMTHRRFQGALILGILGATALGATCGVTRIPTALHPPNFAIAFQADIPGARTPALAPLLLSLVLVDFFDTLGTVSAVAEQARLHGAESGIPRLRPVLVVDSIAASIGGLLGVSSVTSYIESAAGVAEGARTGLHSVGVGLLFLLSMIAAPLVTIIPAAATAPALVMVGFLMMRELARVDFDQRETGIPAFVILVTLPLTYSISHGIGYGFLTYVAIQVLSARAREVRPAMYAATALFAIYFWRG